MFVKKKQHNNCACFANYTVVRFVYEFYLHKFTLYNCKDKSMGIWHMSVTTCKHDQWYFTVNSLFIEYRNQISQYVYIIPGVMVIITF